MAEPIDRQTVRVQTWPGLQTNGGPMVGEPGSAEEQVNLRANEPGRLATRPGLVPVTFDSE